MKIVFTLCSNNYLAQAKILGDSLLLNNPDYQFIIGLVDRLSEMIDYQPYQQFEVTPIENLEISDFEAIWKKYNIIELNTAVKPSFIKYLLKKYPNSQHVLYFDPDIKIYGSLASIESQFESGDILLTPHVNTPIPIDNHSPDESVFLNRGLFNLGFIGIKSNSIPVNQMLDWWEERTLTYGFDNVSKGLFVDQLWVNLVPLYFSRVSVIKSFGFNCAPWNLHERINMKRVGTRVVMIDNSELIFYHFSSYKYQAPEKISNYYDRYSLKDNEVLESLYTEYQDDLLTNKIDELSKVDCYYVTRRQQLNLDKLNARTRTRKILSFWKPILIGLIPPVLVKLFLNHKGNN